jgi:transposase
MMGSKDRSFQPVVGVSLEGLVPADHFYRHLESQLDLSFVRDLVRDRYSHIGRPSIDPVVFFRLQLVMFFEGVRSERQLMVVASDRLSLRWYLGYDLNERLPDHSSLTRIRERYGLEVFRRFFEEIVERCAGAGLVWGKELYFDATKVEANASLDSVAPRFAVEAHLAALFVGGTSETRGDGGACPEPFPVDLSDDALRELTEENAERHDWIAEEGRQDRGAIHGHYRRISDYRTSRTDPDASLMQRRSGGSHLGYHTHYAVDGGKARIILQALVTPSEVMENQPMLDLLWRARFRWKLHPHHVTGDTTYGTTENIVAVEGEGIRAYMPLPDFDSRTPYFGKLEFRYDPGRDVYICPQGETLRFAGRKYDERITRYRADASTCNSCPRKPECTPGSSGRQVRRSFDEEYLERVRGYHETEGYKKAMRKRQVWVEPLFGEGKQWNGLGRFRLRRLRQVNIEAVLIATGQNLKRLLSWRGWGRRNFPGGAIGARLAPIPPQTHPI